MRQKEQIALKLKELQIASTALSHRYSATIALFSAACLENNTEQMDSCRAQCLALVEQILDNSAAQTMLTRQLFE